MACNFWLVANHALAGRADEARRLFERLLSLRNDVGLLAEQYDTRSVRQVGNFPQAFTHVPLILAAHLVERTPSRNGSATLERQGDREAVRT